jgi:glutamate-5-semialdehyde dehydrogenase
MDAVQPLHTLQPGMPIVFGGDKVRFVPDELAAAFRPGDRLVVVQDTGDLLHVPAAEAELVDAAVARAHEAFLQLARLVDADAGVTRFYRAFAERLADDAAFAAVAEANAADVADAQARGRSTTRLQLTQRMRADMIAGLSGWAEAAPQRDAVLERLEHAGWAVEQRKAPLGVVGFVFEGRPNVFADATGVLRSGNAVVFRIGSDALGTARAIVRNALDPALAAAGLPPGLVALLDTPSRSAGWALFSHRQLALAVARGSGEAVEQLGAVARQAAIPVSLHGTGGAWLVAGHSADFNRFMGAVTSSLDRKVCNTLNVACVLEGHAEQLVPRFLAAVQEAAHRRATNFKLHVAEGSERWLDPDLFEGKVRIRRAEGEVFEPQAERLAVDDLGREWEWEDSPEVSLVVVRSVDEAVGLFNRLSPRLAVSLVADDAEEQERFWQAVDAPFVGDGFTRWVDGQFALGRPELGLSNWQHGRLFARSAVLSGDSVFTVRTRAFQADPDLRR